jgi:hypothetical protein
MQPQVPKRTLLRKFKGDKKMRQIVNISGWDSASGSLGTYQIKRELGEIDVAYGNAFSYLFRRFGAPLHECDTEKSIAAYYLTTAHTDVGLRVIIGGEYASIGYALSPQGQNIIQAEEAWLARRNMKNKTKIFSELRKSGLIKLRNDEENRQSLLLIQEKMTERNITIYSGYGGYGIPPYWSVAYPMYLSLRDAALDLLTPEWVRDVPINLLGC